LGRAEEGAEPMMSDERLFPVQVVRAFCVKLLVAHRVPKDQAECIVDCLLQADIWGISSHGILRLPVYVRRVDRGALQREAIRQIAQDSKTTAILEGGNAFGQILATWAMELAIIKAETMGVGVVGVRNSHHFGAAGVYSVMATTRGMMGIAMSNTTPLMPAIGGRQAVVGNNPLSLAVPGPGGRPIILDISLSVAALGKIMVAKDLGQAIPSNWALDSNGNPTDNAAEALATGLLLPIGNHKGLGLALFIDIMAGVMTGSGFGPEVLSIYKELKKPNRCGHLLIALDIARFLPLEEFQSRIERMSRYIKESPRRSGVEKIYLPGEMELETEKVRREQGIPISEVVCRELAELGREAGIRGEPFGK
jgi:ureidoglycolate dehydrogenase (NAD+)